MKSVEITYLLCDDVSMFIRELFLAYLFTWKIFSFITLWKICET